MWTPAPPPAPTSSGWSPGTGSGGGGAFRAGAGGPAPSWRASQAGRRDGRRSGRSRRRLRLDPSGARSRIGRTDARARRPRPWPPRRCRARRPARLAAIAVGVRQVLEQVADRLDPEGGDRRSGALQPQLLDSRLGRGSERSGAELISSWVRSCCRETARRSREGANNRSDGGNASGRQDRRHAARPARGAAGSPAARGSRARAPRRVAKRLRDHERGQQRGCEGLERRPVTRSARRGRPAAGGQRFMAIVTVPTTPIVSQTSLMCAQPHERRERRGDDRHAGRCERTSTKAIGPGEQRRVIVRRSHLGDHQREERRRERRVQAEGLRVADRVAADGADGGARAPRPGRG